MASHTHSFRAMGSTFRLRIDVRDLPADRDEHVPSLLHEAALQVEALEQCMSRFRATSELTELNLRTGQPASVSPTLADVLRLAQTMFHETQGAFDPRVFTSLEQIGYLGVPISPRSSTQLSTSGSAPWITWHDHDTVSLLQPIDLGGIGKGYTADRLADFIERHVDAKNLVGYIVDAGGDLVLWGTQADGEPWNAGVENPLKPTELAATIRIAPEPRRTAVCTSSTWRRTWEHNGVKVHHLIDPMTSLSVQTNVKSVTAMGYTAAITEILTKYVFLRGIPKTFGNTEDMPRCLRIYEDGALDYTPAMASALSWVSPHLPKIVQLSV